MGFRKELVVKAIKNVGETSGNGDGDPTSLIDLFLTEKVSADVLWLLFYSDEDDEFMGHSNDSDAEGSQLRNGAKLAVQQHPELLMAAHEGDPTRLTHLLRNGHAADQPGHMAVNIGAGIALDVAIDLELNTILHVVASSGDSPKFLESARVVYARASHLLVTCNAKGDTPFHCAARAGMVNMVSQHIRLAREEGRVKEAVGKQNREGETALHEALRLADKATVEAMVRMLMEADDELAKVSPTDGASPLYLAVLLGHDDIAEGLHRPDKELSYSGPNGQNALHAAVLRSTRMTNNLLQWNKELSKQGDKTNGSTPLHFAASCGFHDTVVSLLNADKSLAFLSDDDGSCGLRHPEEDNDGNTVLHLAVLSGKSRACHLVLWDKDVLLNLPNRDQKTALDLSLSKIPPVVYFGLHPRSNTHSLLKLAGARYGAHTEKRYVVSDEKTEAKKISESAQTVGIVSALLVTISFAAAFTVPGGYCADDDPNPKFPTSSNHTAGTPVLAATYSFQAFIVANNLALLCSSMATISLMHAGITTVDIHTRMNNFFLSIFFLNSSARSLAAAFAFGMYAALAPVARAAAVFTSLCVAASLLDVAWFVCKLSTSQLVLLNRLGVGSCMLHFVASAVCPLVAALWPYAIIVGFLAYSKIHGIH
ncbi:unnamed protein product [Alopecurus aequalis]